MRKTEKFAKFSSIILDNLVVAAKTVQYWKNLPKEKTWLMYQSWILLQDWVLLDMFRPVPTSLFEIWKEMSGLPDIKFFEFWFSKWYLDTFHLVYWFGSIIKHWLDRWKVYIGMSSSKSKVYYSFKIGFQCFIEPQQIS